MLKFKEFVHFDFGFNFETETIDVQNRTSVCLLKVVLANFEIIYKKRNRLNYGKIA